MRRCATPAATTLPGRGELRRLRHAARGDRAGAAHEVLPLAQIAPQLIERLRSTAGMSRQPGLTSARASPRLETATALRRHEARRLSAVAPRIWRSSTSRCLRVAPSVRLRHQPLGQRRCRAAAASLRPSSARSSRSRAAPLARHAAPGAAQLPGASARSSGRAGSAGGIVVVQVWRSCVHVRLHVDAGKHRRPIAPEEATCSEPYWSAMLTSMARLPLHTLPAFRAVAQLQNLRAAADELHLTHSAVSQQIRCSRSSSASQLFERRGRAHRAQRRRRGAAAQRRAGAGAARRRRARGRGGGVAARRSGCA